MISKEMWYKEALFEEETQRLLKDFRNNPTPEGSQQLATFLLRTRRMDSLREHEFSPLFSYMERNQNRSRAEIFLLWSYGQEIGQGPALRVDEVMVVPHTMQPDLKVGIGEVRYTMAGDLDEAEYLEWDALVRDFLDEASHGYHSEVESTDLQGANWRGGRWYLEGFTELTFEEDSEEDVEEAIRQIEEGAREAGADLSGTHYHRDEDEGTHYVRITGEFPAPEETGRSEQDNRDSTTRSMKLSEFLAHIQDKGLKFSPRESGSMIMDFSRRKSTSSDREYLKEVWSVDIYEDRLRTLLRQWAEEILR